MTLFEEEYAPIIPVWDKEMWLLDPGPFIDIAFELGFSNFVFRAQYHEAATTRQDFTKFIDMFSRGRPWRAIWMPYPGNFCVMFNSISGWEHPVAVHRVWRASTDKLSEMEAMFHENLEPGRVLGTFGVHSRTDSWPVGVVDGQPHRLVLANAPQDEAMWGKIAEFAQRLQATNPDRTIHFHGQKSVGRTIGIAAKSFDHPVRLGWDNGFPRVLMPNGAYWAMGKKATKYQDQWLRLVGASHKEIQKFVDRKELSREVYRVNLLSLRWAFLNWDRAWDFRRIALDDEDIESADLDWEPKRLPIRMRRTKTEDPLLDRWTCDTCSLQLRCPYSREGAVCIVPDSEPTELAAFFGTRNSSTIIEGLSTILMAQSRRATRGMKAEATRDLEVGETGLSPEVTKILNSVFDRGVQLAKLVDPKLAARMSPKINVGVINSGVTPSTTPQMLMVGITAELEARGIDLADATPDMIAKILSEHTLAIEATSSEGDS